MKQKRMCQIAKITAILACMSVFGPLAQASEVQEGQSAASDAAEPAAPAPATAPESVPQLAEAAKAGDKSESYNIKLRDIEERVNDLKERIFQSKARLVQLQEVVLHGTISGAKARLVHVNDMGSSFRLIRAEYSLDGTLIYNQTDDGSGNLWDQKEIEIYNGSVGPGNHTISVTLEYQGHGYGIFSYLSDYVFKIRSSETFTAEEGRLTTVRVIGYERGNITTELKDRPSITYKVTTSRAFREGEGGSEEADTEGE